nr:MAG TPA: hypothetical protein [Caudoviricetes sp.]
MQIISYFLYFSNFSCYYHIITLTLQQINISYNLWI